MAHFVDLAIFKESSVRRTINKCVTAAEYVSDYFSVIVTSRSRRTFRCSLIDLQPGGAQDEGRGFLEEWSCSRTCARRRTRWNVGGDFAE